MSSFEVLRAGPLTTVQDLGRSGLAHLGVPRSGAADLPALLRANELVGNPPGAAALETTLAGPALRFGAPGRVALTGAPAPVTLAGRAARFGVALEVEPGDVLDVGAARAGVRSYVAIGGGIDVVPVLGSRSRDTLTGLGPAPLTRGDVVAFGGSELPPGRPGAAQTSVGARDGVPGAAPRRVTAGDGGADAAGTLTPDADARRPGEPAASATLLHIVLGPREDRFTAAAVSALTAGPFTVSPSSNRIGVRLEGPALEQRAADELPSEGLVRGAIQVPGSGSPIVMLADHPTTGGYPVIAVVAEADHGALGQLRPGSAVRFALHV